MTFDFAHSTKANADRRAKAETIVEFMLDTRFVREPEADEWSSLLLACGVKRASEETRALALQLWRERRPPVVGRLATIAAGQGNEEPMHLTGEPFEHVSDVDAEQADWESDV